MQFNAHFTMSLKKICTKLINLRHFRNVGWLVLSNLGVKVRNSHKGCYNCQGPYTNIWKVSQDIESIFKAIL